MQSGLILTGLFKQQLTLLPLLKLVLGVLAGFIMLLAAMPLLELAVIPLLRSMSIHSGILSIAPLVPIPEA